MTDKSSDAVILLSAAAFAASRHRDQKRKGADASPYINHPLDVANVLAGVGGVVDVEVLVAALLHDTVEDTDTSPDELEERFGTRVRELVDEVSDDKSLPKQERKQIQVEHSYSLSPGAKLLKLGDKICNVRDVVEAPPSDWPLSRRLDYLDWATAVVAGCRGINAPLERHFDQLVAEGRTKLSE
jgi:guanosine-3',5'-bis(diphosphate) 3'-pyrophosphohydrolase